MATFFFKAKNKEGKFQEGEMEADEEKEVFGKLRADGFFPILVEKKPEKDRKKKKGGFSFGVPLKEKTIFCRHLGVMLSSGLSVSRALNILAEQEKNFVFKKAILDIGEQVKKGTSLASSMALYPKIFDQVFVSMVKVGETGGSLEEILRILSDQLEKDYKLVSKVRGAMIYPAVIVLVMIVIGFLMMAFVVPKITAIFKDFDADLPFLTKVILNLSNFISQNILLSSGLILGVSFSIFTFYKTQTGKSFFHRAFLIAPVLGPIICKVNSARFARILSSLLNSGVSLIEALKITADTLGNFHFKKMLVKAAEEVQKGVTLSAVLSSSKHSYFPYMVLQMLEVGEETGKTSDVLKKLAEFYEEEVEQTTKNLSSIIEPVLMVVIGAAVGIFAIAIIQPIYSIMEKI